MGTLTDGMHKSKSVDHFFLYLSKVFIMVGVLSLLLISNYFPVF